MLEMYAKPYIKGFTTNPTLMRKAGLTDYRAFARDIVAAIPDRPISFEVFSDEFDEMERQAREIATWGENVYVKIPVTNTRREPAYDLVRRLANDGVKLNVTAIMTIDQVRNVVDAVKDGAPSCVSVFAGRIADTGRDPVPIMAECVDDPEGRAAVGTDLGQPARAAEHHPGRRHRLPHHHRHQRHPQEAAADRQGPRRLLARHGQDVLRRRPEGGVHALIFVTGAAGFIGFHVSKRLLERGEDVVGIDNLNDYYDPALKHARLDILRKFERFEFVRADIADRAAMRGAVRAPQAAARRPPRRAGRRALLAHQSARVHREQHHRLPEHPRGMPPSRRRASRLRVVELRLRREHEAAVLRARQHRSSRLALRRDEKSERADGAHVRAPLRRRRPPAFDSSPCTDRGAGRTWRCSVSRAASWPASRSRSSTKGG